MVPAIAHTPPGTPAPFVDRERERGLLREHLDVALAGCGGTVLVGGEAGIGKSALVEALGREAADRGALVLGGGCYDLTETPPYGPWRESFRRGAALAREAPALAGIRLPDFADAAGRDALLAEACGAVVALTDHAPLVLVLEDLHWADPASLDLLRVLAREAPALPLLLLATYRADELPRRHPLALLLPVLAREAGAARLDLRRLPAAALAALVAAHYRVTAGDGERLAAHLLGRAGGNPFFSLQLLHALEEDGVLRPSGDGWTVGKLERASLPPSLRQVVDARLARLDEAGQALLETAAVIGQEVPFGLWAAVAGRAEEELFAVAEAAVRARLVEPTPDGAGIAFAHALVREALYEGLLPFRRREAHRRVGEALGALADPDPDAVARHFRQAGDP
ncbi:MAG TPA: AAA family ATPase, partial [Vicinamibacteria bacterium]